MLRVCLDDRDEGWEEVEAFAEIHIHSGEGFLDLVARRYKCVVYEDDSDEDGCHGY